MSALEPQRYIASSYMDLMSSDSMQGKWYMKDSSYDYLDFLKFLLESAGILQFNGL
jgi:hypothetical protein